MQKQIEEIHTALHPATTLEAFNDLNPFFKEIIDYENGEETTIFSNVFKNEEEEKEDEENSPLDLTVNKTS